MKYTAEQYANSLVDALSNIPVSRHNRLIKNFVDMVKKNQDQSESKKIVSSVQAALYDQSSVYKIYLTSKIPITNLDSLAKKIQSLFSQKIELHNATNDKILGGIIINLPDTKIDLSINSKLAKVKSKTSAPAPSLSDLEKEIVNIIGQAKL